MSEQRKAVIKNADMSEEMQQDAVDCASAALSKYNIEKVRLMNFFNPFLCPVLIFRMERQNVYAKRNIFFIISS